MTDSINSQTDESTDPKATTWLKPKQVEALRAATVERSQSHLADRNDALIALLYDSGLRVNECVSLDVGMVDLDEGIVMLPSEIQKQYPATSDRTPEYVEIKLAGEIVRTLRKYLNTRWKESKALFPSRQSDRMTSESARNVVRRAAEAGDVQPYTTTGRGSPDQITPHTLRHSVAYRMLNHEEGNTLYDVTKRLRHATILTTERVYSHFDRV